MSPPGQPSASPTPPPAACHKFRVSYVTSSVSAMSVSHKFSVSIAKSSVTSRAFQRSHHVLSTVFNGRVTCALQHQSRICSLPSHELLSLFAYCGTHAARPRAYCGAYAAYFERDAHRSLTFDLWLARTNASVSRSTWAHSRIAH
eukprot:3941097-Rhodomonas_salina.1